MSGDVPEGWQEVSLSDCLEDFRNGWTYDTRALDGTMPITRIETISNGEIDYDRIGFAQADDRIEAFRLRQNDILFSHINSVEHIAKVAIKGDERPLYHGMNLMRLRPNERVVSHFLFARLQSDETRDHFRAACKRAVNQASLNKGEIGSYQFPLPPLDEQRRITEVLRSVDEVLKATRSALELLTSLKEGVLRDTLAHDPLPRGWTLTPIGHLGAKTKHAIVDGPFGSNLKSEHYRSSGIPVFQSGFVTSSQFKPTKYVFVDKDLFQQQIRSRAVGGDILMAKIGAQAGRCAIIPSDHPEGIIAGNCIKITVDPCQCSTEFLHTVLTYMYGATGLREIITETAQPAISLARLKNLLVPLPPLGEQKAIMEGIHALDLALETEGRKQSKLNDLKAALMSDLLSGRVRVPA